MAKSKNLSAATKKVVEKRALEVPKMAITAQIWLASVTKPKHLSKLHEQGYLPEQSLGEWKAPGEHRIPNLEPSEIVLFVLFIQHGLGLPACPFLHRFLHYYGSTLNHLNPNSILHLSIFVHLYETSLSFPRLSLYFATFSNSNHTQTPQVQVVWAC